MATRNDCNTPASTQQNMNNTQSIAHSVISAEYPNTQTQPKTTNKVEYVSNHQYMNVFERIKDVLTNTTYRRSTMTMAEIVAQPKSNKSVHFENPDEDSLNHAFRNNTYFTEHPIDFITQIYLDHIRSIGIVYLQQIERHHEWFIQTGNKKTVIVDEMPALDLFEIRKLVAALFDTPQYLYYYHYELKFIANSFVKQLLRPVVYYRNNTRHERTMRLVDFSKFHGSMIFSMIADCLDEELVSFDGGEFGPADAEELMFRPYQKVETRNFIFIKFGATILKINKETSTCDFDIKFIAYYCPRPERVSRDFVISFERSSAKQLASQLCKHIKIYEPSLAITDYANKAMIRKKGEQFYCVALIGEQMFTNNYEIWQAFEPPILVEFIRIRTSCRLVPSFEQLYMN
jgi:hypothetical protein